MRLPFMRFRAEGNSMEPAIKEGERVLVFGWAYLLRQPKPGDIIVAREPREKSRKILKRVEKVAGDMIWLVGDNSWQSTDSRTFGPISKKDVLGKVVFKY